MEKQKNIPVLRFPEFEGEWEKNMLSNVCELKGRIGYRGYTTDDIVGKGEGVLAFNPSNITDTGSIIFKNNTYITWYKYEESPEIKVKNGHILLVKTGSTFGKVALVENLDEKATVNPQIVVVKPEGASNKFLSLLMLNTGFQKQINEAVVGGAIPTISQELILKFKLAFPTLPEQQKIATFFTAIDQKISQLKRKHHLLEQYKKGVMQKIFSQQIRFKDDYGREFPKWEKKRLGEIADRTTEKNKVGNQNVLTISAQQGLVSQLDFFNKSVAAKDLTGYYLLKQDDFAYNKSYSAGYPMGAIKRLKLYEAGVVSTLYFCFKFRDSVSLSFFEQYFESGLHNREIEKVAQEGARNHGLLNIGVSDFFSTIVKVPSLPEQTKIANFLSAIDDKIHHTQKQIEKAEQWKKGLMQKMFV